MTTSYKYEVDWDNLGLWLNEYTDITAYVLNSRWKSGRNAAYEFDFAGQATIRLDNSTSIFSPYNAASPLYGYIHPGLRCKITMTVDGNSTMMWAGYLDSIIPVVVPSGSGPNVSYAELTAYDILAQFSEQSITLPICVNGNIGALVTAVLDADGVPLLDRNIDTGWGELDVFWVSKEKSVLQALRELQVAEMGRIRAGKNGNICFESRAHIYYPPHATTQATYGTGTLNIWNLRQENPISGVFNQANGFIRRFTVSQEGPLVILANREKTQGNSIPIPAKVGGTNGVRTLYVDVPGPGTPSQCVGVSSWGTIELEANTAADGGGSDITDDVSATITAYGSRGKLIITSTYGDIAYVTHLVLRGVGIVEGTPLEIQSADLVSQGYYRKREYPNINGWLTDLDYGQAYLNMLVSSYGYPRPQLTFDVKASYNTAHLNEARTREVSDNIRVVAPVETFGVAIDANFSIDSIEHFVDSDRNHTMTIVCTEPAANYLAANYAAFSPSLGSILVGCDQIALARDYNENMVITERTSGEDAVQVQRQDPLEGALIKYIPAVKERVLIDDDPVTYADNWIPFHIASLSTIQARRNTSNDIYIGETTSTELPIKIHRTAANDYVASVLVGGNYVSMVADFTNVQFTNWYYTALTSQLVPDMGEDRALFTYDIYTEDYPFRLYRHVTESSLWKAAVLTMSGYVDLATVTDLAAYQPVITTGDLVTTQPTIISITRGTGAVIETGSGENKGTVIEVAQASAESDGFLSSEDYQTIAAAVEATANIGLVLVDASDTDGPKYLASAIHAGTGISIAANDTDEDNVRELYISLSGSIDAATLQGHAASYFQVAGSYEVTANKGAASGYCGLSATQWANVPGCGINIALDEADSFYIFDTTTTAYAVGVTLDTEYGGYRMYLDASGGWMEVLTTGNVGVLGVEFQANKGAASGYVGLDAYQCAVVPGSGIWFAEDVNDSIYIGDSTGMCNAVQITYDSGYGGFCMYLTSWIEGYALNAVITEYDLDLILADYVTSSALSSALSGYLTSSGFATYFKSYLAGLPTGNGAPPGGAGSGDPWIDTNVIDGGYTIRIKP